MTSLRDHTAQTTARYYLALSLSILVVGVSFLFNQQFLHGAPDVQSNIGYLVGLQFSLLFFIMLAAWHYGPKTQNPSDYKTLLLIAVAARIILFPIEPYMSNDVERYLFDGYIASIGLDPYTVSHNHPSLADAVTQWAPPAEHLKYPTLYPPMALALFSLAASFGPELAPIIWKAITILTSVATVFIGLIILQKLGKLQHLALIALSPILILESGIGVHIDTFSTLFIALAIWALLSSKTDRMEVDSNKLLLCGIFIGLGTLTKLLPLVLLAPCCIYLARFSLKQASYLALATITTLIMGYALSFVLGLTPVGSIGVFFEKFRFGSPYFYWLEQHLDLARVALITAVILTFGYAVLVLVTWSKAKAQFDNSLWIAAQVALALPLFFSPVVYSWYLAPLALLVALRPNLPLMVWLALMPLTYEVLGNWICCNEWRPAIWPIGLIATGLCMSFAYLFFKRPAKQWHHQPAL